MLHRRGAPGVALGHLGAQQVLQLGHLDLVMMVGFRPVLSSLDHHLLVLLRLLLGLFIGRLLFRLLFPDLVSVCRLPLGRLVLTNSLCVKVYLTAR